MEDFLPYFTGDSSVGLYSTDFDDIYHSAYGALAEAFEKFVLPLEGLFKHQQDIKVLDVCYGLGYNSKAFINYFGDKHNIEIDCLDIDKNLFLLSPFIKTNKNIKDKIFMKLNKNYGKNFIPENQKEKIIKYTKLAKYKKYKIEDWVNYILIENLYDEFGDELFDNFYTQDKKFSTYFESKFSKLSNFYQKRGINYTSEVNKSTNLHNIYYRNISKRYTIPKNNKIILHFYVNDARNTIKQLNNQYDVIMLDAFTTDKCPMLWSFDFIKELYNNTADGGVLVTYSNSVIVRNTLLSAGYFIGKILNKNNKSIGTIAAKNNSLILNKFDEYELGLMQETKAGIPYRDNGLKLTAEEIINNRKTEVNNSDLLSSSKYIKQYKGKRNEI